MPDNVSDENLSKLNGVMAVHVPATAPALALEVATMNVGIAAHNYDQAQIVENRCRHALADALRIVAEKSHQLQAAQKAHDLAIQQVRRHSIDPVITRVAG